MDGSVGDRPERSGWMARSETGPAGVEDLHAIGVDLHTQRFPDPHRLVLGQLQSQRDRAVATVDPLGALQGQRLDPLHRDGRLRLRGRISRGQAQRGRRRTQYQSGPWRGPHGHGRQHG